jgi:hypothetical protein
VPGYAKCLEGLFSQVASLNPGQFLLPDPRKTFHTAPSKRAGGIPVLS